MPTKCSAVILTGSKTGSAESVLYRPCVEWVIENIVEMGVSTVLLTEEVAGLGGFDGVQLYNGTKAVADFANEQKGDILIARGDVPLLSPATMERALKLHRNCSNDLTAIRSEKAHAVAVWSSNEMVAQFLKKKCALDPELYHNMPVHRSACCFPLSDNELVCADSKRELFYINNYLRGKVINRMLDLGIEITDPAGVTIAGDAKIGAGTVIHKGTIVKKGCVIGKNCELGPDTVLTQCSVGDGTTLNAVAAEMSSIGSGVKIGPFSHIRPNSVISDGVKIGNFVEVKNSAVGEKTSVAHLTYIGDTDCGAKVNWGCGCVTVNYDGDAKYRTVIGDNVFIGCNTNLVAPVTVEDGAYIAAGSTITEKVPAKSLAIARSRQVVKDNWTKKEKGGNS